VAGLGAVNHHIYMDTNQALVEARDPSVDRDYVDTNSYTHDLLAVGATYYLIADNNDGTFEWPGATWIYPTYNFVMIDPIQDYATNDVLRDVWNDNSNYGVGNNGGVARIETEAPLRETWEWVNLLEISDMALEFEALKIYQYAEIRNVFPEPLDLDTAGATSLRIYWHGEDYNDEFDDKMYVALEDSLGNKAYSEWEDSNDFEQAIWSKIWFEWNIALTDFGGVDTDDIAKMYIGIGDTSDPCNITNGTNATIFFDDIQAQGPACLSRNDRRLPADFAQQFDGTRYYDCTVGVEDLMVMRGAWLISSQDVCGASFTTGSPIAHWKFDESDLNSPTAVDFASIDANSYDLETSTLTAPWVAEGAPAPYLATARCAESPGDFAFNMESIAVFGLFNYLSDGVTFSWWSYGNPAAYVGPSSNWTSPAAAAQFFGGKRGGGNQQAFMFQFPMTFTIRVGQLLWRTSEVPTTPTWQGYDNCSWIGNKKGSNFSGQWNHLAMTKDIPKGHQIAYLNGDILQMAINRKNPFTILDNAASKFHVFAAWQNGALKFPFVGKIDDFRIYDYALSHAEVLYLAGREGESITTGLPNGVEGDADLDGDVDLGDYAILGNQWMQTQLWP
ncbi:MAG: LamG-like jellyroll fold domain-containing protein, partial [Planctomycetota bacterium]